MKIAIVMIHYGSEKRTEESLKGLLEKIDSHRLILINNTKRDITRLTKIIKDTQLIDNRENVGFAKAVNQGMALGLADKSVTHVMLLNNDLHIAYGTLRELLLTYKKGGKVGIVSPILHHGVINGSSGLYDWGGKYNKWTGMVKHANWENKPKTVLTVDHVAGAAMLISREVIEKIGMFDERFFLYYEDLDFCLRAQQAGYTIHINPEIVGEHDVSANSNLLARTFHQWRSHLLFLMKYMPIRAYPTALIYDTIFYPLALLKALISK